MIHPVETINLMAIGHWNDDLNGIDKELFGINENGLMDKVKEDKLACDVDDFSSLFVELEEENVDVQLPFENEAEVMDNWIGGLEQDAVNVDELSAVFAQLVDEQASSLSSNDDADVEMSDSDEEDEDIQIQMVPCAPTWAMMAPLDPRSAIRTPVFKDVDSRIPRVKIPRMDLSFDHLVKPLITTSTVKEKKEMAKKSEYKHDAATCWICKSDKSTFKKFALHRYLAKRHRRNWKRGPRYSGRSNVATSRVRDGGRFIQTAQWI